MENKQKQIEEMAIIINGSTEMDTMGYYRSVEKAKNIYNAGYRKIPENAVVVDKEKYDRLIEKINRGWLPEPSDWDFRIKLAKEQTRKETALKFAEKLSNYFVEHCVGRLHISLTLQEWYKMIDEICKELTEGKV